MKQVVQNIRTGRTEIVEVPCPKPSPGGALVRTAASVVSVGTERMVVEFASRSLIGKARSRPDLVRQVLQKARREGFLTAMRAAFRRLSQPMPLGYSSAGTVVEVGEGVGEFHPGDRVACAGGGHAVHAEFASVPVNLMAPVPAGVDLEEAAFATLGAIALHGFRLSEAALGESVAVVGLGVLGLLVAQIAAAAGCRVWGVDLDPARVKLARRLGAGAAVREGAEDAARTFTASRGFDAVIVCADASSSDPLALAGAIARDRGRVIAVGATGMTLPRKPYYEKELDFRVSRSYGPGRYDLLYEEAGVDYPYGYVRWTEQRNLAAFLDLVAAGKVRIGPLAGRRFALKDAAGAYALISGKTKKKESFLGVLLTYPPDAAPAKSIAVRPSPAPQADAAEQVRLGVLGAGLFATQVALPAVARIRRVEKVSIVSGGGLTAALAAKEFGFLRAAADPADVLNDPAINAVAIFTRHHLHAALASRALGSGKHVFCEKPLALREEELLEVERAWKDAAERAPLTLMVGFNRRFAPLVEPVRRMIAEAGEPPVLAVRVNAGALPRGHWTQDPVQGGGRILGEACHFVDLMTFLAGSAPVRVFAGGASSFGVDTEDNFAATLEFAGGAVGTLVYSSAGDRAFPKERIEVFCGGRAAVIDDFRTAEIWRGGSRHRWRSPMAQDKGHRAVWEAFIRCLHDGGPAPIPAPEIFAVTRATFALLQAVRQKTVVEVSGG
ncbi:MAG: bi-domain-containing oxidoreductase [Anaerolineales bacterium]|nr:bi-domain-containing oxidoreductase [Anaerolineales bacterium]